MTSSYLWNRTGTPDAELDRIEARLRIFADIDVAPLVLPPRAPVAAHRPWRGFVAAAVVTLAAGLSVAAWASTPPDPVDERAAIPTLSEEDTDPADVPPEPTVAAPDDSEAELAVAGGITINGRTLEEFVAEACAAGNCVHVGDDVVIVDPPPPPTPARKPARRGKLDKAEVKRVVRSDMGDLRRCVDEGRRRDPSLAGRIDLEFRVGSRGKVESAKVIRSTLGSRAVSACIEGVAKRWTFERDKGASARVVYPLFFGPGPSSPASSASLTKREVRAVMHAHLDELRRCYRRGLARDPELAGRITVRFTVDRNGRVPTADVDSQTLPDRDVGRCIAAAIEGWRFPKPANGRAVVKYPLRFQP